MDSLVKEGAAILMISSELPEIIGMSDRIYVMREGRIVAEMAHAEATQEKIIEYAMGADEVKRNQQKTRPRRKDTEQLRRLLPAAHYRGVRRGTHCEHD